MFRQQYFILVLLAFYNTPQDNSSDLPILKDLETFNGFNVAHDTRLHEFSPFITELSQVVLFRVVKTRNS